MGAHKNGNIYNRKVGFVNSACDSLQVSSALSLISRDCTGRKDSVKIRWPLLEIENPIPIRSLTVLTELMC